MIADTNMKKPEKNMGTHRVYPEIFHLCSTGCPANVNEIFELFPCTPQLCLTEVGYGL
jgi:hypothetical protein